MPLIHLSNGNAGIRTLVLGEKQVCYLCALQPTPTQKDIYWEPLIYFSNKPQRIADSSERTQILFCCCRCCRCCCIELRNAARLNISELQMSFVAVILTDGCLAADSETPWDQPRIYFAVCIEVNRSISLGWQLFSTKNIRVRSLGAVVYRLNHK